ncbi:MAG TPA: glycoside hydrolase family 15 protein [Polyangiaceae bacterium]|nr:glycoside hydrolase family 15 protein [Polyangiaceae bacterium]
MLETAIQDYGIIGDGRSAALVTTSGSIEWLCWPRFDSPSFFAAVLDASKGGAWRIVPRGPFRTARAYLPESNVLATTFEGPSGAVRVLDAMTAMSEEEKCTRLVPEHELLRIVEGLRGEIELELSFAPRPDYARRLVPLREKGMLGVRLELGGDHLCTLRSDGPRRNPGTLALREDGTAIGQLTLRAGERSTFSLTFDSEAPAVLPPLGADAWDRLERTTAWWQRWVAACRYTGPHRDAIVRSLLALKLLSYAPTGAIVAAPTTSLPERVGGDLNWDYRYCWLRDASLTARVFLALGYEDEAHAFVSWLLHTTRLTRPELRILYDVYGRPPKSEATLDHLSGYRASRPVRIQNAAADQLQLDTYGEVIDAVAQLCRRGAWLDGETRQMLREFGETVCASWSEPDHGIWEERDRRRPYTHSRVLCWTALDRLLELHRRGHLKRLPAACFAEHRARVRADIEQHAWNPRLRCYTQVLGGDTVDLGVLAMSEYGFHPASHPRMRATFERLVERLELRPGLFYRYEQSRAANEGAFGICCFWAAEFLAAGGGSLDEARSRFEATLQYANDLGLFAEEIDGDTGAPLGNFPQAFTHLGLIGAALALEERARAVDARPTREAHSEARP